MSLDRRAFLATPFLVAAASAAEGKRPPRVLLRSAWQTVNIGDVAHTPGMLRLLAEHVPAAEVTVLPSKLEARETAMLRRNFPKLIVADTPDAVAAAFDRCDFFLHGSGPSLVGQKQLAAWVEKTGKPYGVLGITLGQIADDTKALLDGAKFVYLRDTLSVAAVKGRGVKSPVIDFGPDAAFGVDLRDDAAADKLLKDKGLTPGGFLCAIPRLRNTPYWKIHGREMTAADKAKHADNEANKEKDHAPVRDALVAFVRKTGKKVLVCPEDKSHVWVGKEMFLDKLPADVKDQFVWQDRFWLTDEAVSVYTRSLGLLSMDMHSPIMAVANGVPAVHLRFKQQTSKGQMWRDVGLGDWLFDLDGEVKAADLTDVVVGFAADPAASKKKTVAAMDVVRGRHKAAFTELQKHLPG